MKNLINVVLIVGVFIFTGCENKETIDESNLIKKSDKTTKKNKQKIDEVIKLKTTTNKEIVIKIDDKSWEFVADDYKDKIVILDFFATWCPPCIKAIPHLNSISSKYKKDVVILGLEIGNRSTGNMVSQEKLSEFMMRHNISYDITQGKVTNDLMYGLKSLNQNGSIPFMIIFNKKGQYVQSYVGIADEDLIAKEIEDILQEDKKSE